MTTTTFLLLPDRREGEGPVKVMNTAITERWCVLDGPRVRFWRSLSYETGVPPHYRTESFDLDPIEVVNMARAAEFAWPAHLLYKNGEEDRWNFVTLGLRTEMLPLY